MRMLPIAIALTIGLVPLPRQATQQAASGHTVLSFGHLWNGTTLLDDAVVTVDGGKITPVESGRKALPEGAVDLRRSTAIPLDTSVNDPFPRFQNSPSGEMLSARSNGIGPP